jgi:spermidine/putrescine-binding protein
MGSWAPSETASGLQKSGLDPATTIQYGSLPYPTVSGGKGNSLAWIDDFGFAIPKKAKNAANAEKFIEYFMAKKQLEGISSVATNLTPRSDIPVPPDLADFAKEYQTASKAGTLTNNPDASISNAQWSGQVLDQTVADLFNKKFSSPQAFVSALKARTVTFLQTQG